jgi:thiol:disulfide interchange protein
MMRIRLRSSLLLVCALLIPTFISAQIEDPVHFSTSQKQISPSEVEVHFTAKIAAGWHVYSTNLPSGGPISATLHVDKIKGAVADGKLKPLGKEISKYDKMFDMQLRYFETTCTFVQKFKLTAPEYMLKGYLEFGACNDENCLPPTDVNFNFHGKGTPDAAAANANGDDATTDNANTTPNDTTVQDTAAQTTANANTNVAPMDSTMLKELWTPVISQLKQMGEDSAPANQSWLKIFFLGFLGGFIALFTPCVWPIIPMTVSFFLKRSKDRKRGIHDAITYGISIVAIYVILGLAITAIFGASALNALSTNAIFNIFFFLLLLVFAASFFGWFEISLPSSWSTATDSKAEKTSGLLSIFLMAFTLTLVSFSCTGPIIGFLLVEVSTSGSFVAPTIGMLGFAIALALPFTFFALFPTLLKQMPKSGNWLNNVKVVLGFLELIFSLKFLSIADLAYGWHILDREVFLSLWIIMFVLMGAYLMGWFRFPHDEEEYDEQGQIVAHSKTSVPKFFMALASFAFAVYMVPGLWGAPLRAISAFAPPMNTQDFNLYNNEVKADFQDYEAGMAAAQQQGKPVMIDFTGFGCVNCRKMEGAVWSDPRVADILKHDYILIELHVDDKTPLPAPINITENGQQRTLRTVGDRWSYLQRSKFGANAQPFYVLVDNKGYPLNKSYSYDEDIDKYLKFLNKGLQNYKDKLEK